jgi:putative transcriptional regulator
MKVGAAKAGEDYTETMFRRTFPCWLDCIVALALCIAPLSLRAAEPAGGSSILLVAGESLKDPRFRQTVVLVTRHGRNRSAIGVIFNRALNVSLDRVFPELKTAAPHRLHYGGPVAQGQLVYMARTDVAPRGSIAVAERLFFGSDGASLRQLLAVATPPAQLRVFNGFASWAAGQLEREIERGDWRILPVDVDVLFDDPEDELWPKLWRRATQLRVQAPSPQPISGCGDPDGLRLAAG